MASNMDLATLGLEIRSDGVVVASNRLQQFASHAANAASATSRLTARQRESAGASGAMAAGLAKVRNQVLALAGAYMSLHGAMTFVGRGLDYTSTLESAKIGIATLITSMAKLADAQGNVLQGMDKYVASQAMAEDMLKTIQRLALQTTATTQELVAGVQTVIAPAIQAGMALKDIPRFAVAGAQAMQTMGIPLQQMRTELEALLTGRVSGVQDLLAPRLFPELPISQVGEYIRGLKDSGKLIDELFRRLQPFQVAGEDVAQTWKGLTSNFKEAGDVIAGFAANKYLLSVKQAVKDMTDLLVDTKGAGVGISKEFKGIADVLAEIEGGIGGGILAGTNELVAATRTLNQYITEIGTDQFLKNITDGAKVATAALLALVVARKAASATFVVTTATGETQQVTGLRQYIAVQYEAIRASQLRAKQELATAAAEREAAIATLAKFQADQRAALGVLDVTQAEIIRAAQQKQLSGLTIAATAAETRYAAALRASAAASLSSIVAKGAISKLMAFFGGPLGLALTAATVGFAMFQTRTDAVAEATEALTRAESSYTAAIKAATDETGKLNDKLSAAQKLKIDLAKIDIKQAFDKEIAAVQESIDKIMPDAWLSDFRNVLGIGDFKSSQLVIPQEFLDGFKSLTSALKSGTISAGNYAERLAELRQKAIDAGFGNSALVAVIEELSRDEGAVSKLAALQEKMDKLQQAARGAADGVHELSSAANGLSAALDKAVTESSLEAYISGLGKEQQAIAKGLAKDLKMNESQVKAAMAGEAIPGVDPSKLKQYISLQRQIFQNNKADSLSKQGFKDDTARENIRRLREEINELSGSSQEASAAMAKKLFEISKLGKQAKLSSAEIEKLSQEYKQAFQVKTLRDFDEEMAKLTDDATALRKLEIQKTMDEWTDRFRAAGLSAEEATPKLEGMRKALEKKSDYEDLQAAIDFYKELGEKAGQYGLDLDYVNKMIDKQADAWKRIGIPQDYIDQLVYIRRLEASTEGWDGVKRAMKSYYAEATNLGQQFEDFTSSALTSLEDAFVEFTTTGKTSFSDLANSMISDLVRIAYQAMVIAPIVEGLTGMFSGGSIISKALGASNAAISGISAGIRHTGGMADGSGPSRTVPAQTFVSAPRFHSGGGLFNSDEYPAILLRGERVLNRQETQAYNAGRAASLAPASNTPEISINIINNTGQPMQAQGSTTPNGQGGFNVEIMLDQLEIGLVQRDSAGRSRFANHLDRTRGMSRAGTLYR